MVLRQHINNECFQVCIIIVIVIIILHLFLSCGLLHLLSVTHYLRHQRVCDECCVWRGGDETLLGGGHSGVPGEISVHSVRVCACE